jgi:flavin reductase (DIM6/NTAB) family NADH-FMN oxidoreductase RutF
MAPLQRPASRFFAAFYRWTIYTRKVSYHCVNCTPTHNTKERPRICALYPPISSRFPRTFHTTRRRHQRGVNISEDASDRAAEDTELSEEEMKAHQLRDSVRSFLRNVPSSVAVITAASVDPDTRRRVPMGVAISSIASVTMDPPTISFNLKHPSKTLDAIRAAKGLFRLHYLQADRGGAHVAELFCRGNHPEAYRLRLMDLKLYLPRDKRAPQASQSAAPQIRHDSVCAALECTVTHELPVADHVILVAKVDSAEMKNSHAPTIMYLQGHYKRPEGAILVNHHQRPISPTVSEGMPSVWDFPLFPREEDRQQYMNAIMETVKGNPAYHQKPLVDVLGDIKGKLPYSPHALGINLERLVYECGMELGCEVPESSTSPLLKNVKVLCEFYGRLSTSARSVIIDRAKQLVKAVPLAVHLDSRLFLLNLGVSPMSRDLLPSDILEPLRADGLVERFEAESRAQSPKRSDHGLIQLEQVEHKLRKYLQSLHYLAALQLPLDVAMEQIGEPKTASALFKRSRHRLLAQTHPEEFEAVDITGDVTQDEIRVILSRLSHFLFIRDLDAFRKHVALDPNEILRRVHVHPAITGMDVDFLIAKIKYLYYSTPLFGDFGSAIDRMLEPWFSSTVTWPDLEERVKQFVQKTPLRVTTWSSRDKLAAMGLTWRAMVSIPRNTEQPLQPLNHGVILDTLLAKELKNHYGKGTEAENQAIAKFLKDTYNFDVSYKPLEDAPLEDASTSPSFEMQTAMVAHISAAVSGSNTSQAQAEPEYRQRRLFRRQGVGSTPRIARRTTESPRVPSSRKKHTAGGSTSYSLRRDKKA